MSLQPRQIEEDSPVYDLGDPVLEAFFLESGKFNVGYRMNNKIHFKIAIGSKPSIYNGKTYGPLIGAYDLFFNHKSEYYYRSTI
jgi:hypothetical protein